MAFVISYKNDEFDWLLLFQELYMGIEPHLYFISDANVVQICLKISFKENCNK